MRGCVYMVLSVFLTAAIVGAREDPGATETAPEDVQDDVRKDWPVRAEIVPLEKLSAKARQQLRMARSRDYAYVGRTSGNQMGAIEAYRRYIALASKEEAEFILQPMSRICYLYSNNYSVEKGERRHFSEASNWCRRVLKLAQAHDIVSVEITDLRKLYMTCTLNRMERVNRIAENYRWYKSLTEERIKLNFAKCDKYARYAGENPRLVSPFPEIAEQQFLKMVESLRIRCLEKIDETVTYASEVEVLGAISREFCEEDLGKDLWRKVQEKKARLINGHLDVPGLVYEPLPKSDSVASSRSPAVREAPFSANGPSEQIAQQSVSWDYRVLGTVAAVVLLAVFTVTLLLLRRRRRQPTR